MSACRGCGKEIVWAGTKDGKKIPLDPRPPVFRVYPFIQGGQAEAERVGDNFMVSHFATCPQANKFSASNKK